MQKLAASTLLGLALGGRQGLVITADALRVRLRNGVQLIVSLGGGRGGDEDFGTPRRRFGAGQVSAGQLAERLAGALIKQEAVTWVATLAA